MKFGSYRNCTNWCNFSRERERERRSEGGGPLCYVIGRLAPEDEQRFAEGACAVWAARTQREGGLRPADLYRLHSHRRKQTIRCSPVCRLLIKKVLSSSSSSSFSSSSSNRIVSGSSSSASIVVISHSNKVGARKIAVNKQTEANVCQAWNQLGTNLPVQVRAPSRWEAPHMPLLSTEATLFQSTTFSQRPPQQQI